MLLRVALQNVVGVPSKRSRGADLRVEEICSVEAFTEVAMQWDRLVAGCPRPNLFLTTDWLFSWWRHYGKGRQWQALLVRDEKGCLIGGLPLYSESRLAFGRRYNSLRLIGTQPESPDNLDVVAEASTCIAVANAVCTWIVTVGSQRYDVLVFSNLAKNSHLIESLCSHGAADPNEIRITPLFCCPYLTLPSTFDAYLSSLSKNMRYNVRRRTRQVLDPKEGNKIVCVERDGELPAAMDDLFRLHALRRTARGAETRFTEKSRQKFHRNLASTLLGHNRLKLLLLKEDSQAIAVIYCFKHGSKMLYFQSGFDPRWSKYSVGTVLMAKCIEMAIAEGCKEFDFLRGDEDYKFQWTTCFRQTVEVRYPLSFRGRYVLRLLEGAGRIKRHIRAFVPEAIWQLARNACRR